MKAGDLLIDESELVENFVRASGPGGQNVDKVASAAELRFYARRSPSWRGAKTQGRGLEMILISDIIWS